MAILETHLFNQYVDSGISANVASLAMSVCGVATMPGAALSGFLVMRFRMKNVLGAVYAGRVAIARGFLLLPKGAAFACAATALLGLTGDSTVPPATGIISRKVGAARMAVVYGAIFIGYQLGAFSSAWLGGRLAGGALESAGLWLADLALSAAAAVASFRIRD